MPDGPAAIRLHGVIKDFHGLRPLRIRDLTLEAGESLALLGLDAQMAAALVDLLTGGSLPDSGEVLVFGESTASIDNRETWLRLLDRIGLVTERAVMLEALTAEQNLAIPLSLEVESMKDELRAAARRLAAETGLPAELLSTPFAQLPAAMRLRVRLGRALALDPGLLIAEHPNAPLSRAEARAFAADVREIARARRLALLVCTADAGFAAKVASRVLTLQPATGELTAVSRTWWFR